MNDEMKAELDAHFSQYPKALPAYRHLSAPNEPVVIGSGRMQLEGPKTFGFQGELTWEWVPSPEFRFVGDCDGLLTTRGDGAWMLRSTAPEAVEVEVMLSSIQAGSIASRVQGGIAKPADVPFASSETVKFCLVNFPELLGEPVCVQDPSSTARSYQYSRLRFESSVGECVVDPVFGAKTMVSELERNQGYVITHVGEWRPTQATTTEANADEELDLLTRWFAFLRGTWAGPIFPEGCQQGQSVWRPYADWRVGPSHVSINWLPRNRAEGLSAALRGYVERWRDPKWREPLRLAIAWLVEANSPGVSLESKVIIGQVALEMLAWVFIVETQRLQDRKDFERLSAAGRIRILLREIGLSLDVPDHLASLVPLRTREAPDGPGVITSVRNALVHSTEGKRAQFAALTGEQLWECSELALGYAELVLLRVIGYEGIYTQRGWRGQRLAGERPVPWAAVR